MIKKITIAIDAMGGDDSPDKTIHGVSLFLKNNKQNNDISINLFGDEKKILSSTGALNMSEVPKKMIIIGGGYIGLEMGSVWSRLGSEVHVIEYLDHITPGLDKEISNEFMKILKKQKINFHLNTEVKKVSKPARDIKEKTSKEKEK